MPRRKTPAELERIKAGKDGYNEHSTARELAATIGVNESTVKRWARTGRIPAPDLTSTAGWQLWHPDSVRRIITMRTNRGMGA